MCSPFVFAYPHPLPLLATSLHTRHSHIQNTEKGMAAGHRFCHCHAKKRGNLTHTSPNKTTPQQKTKLHVGCYSCHVSKLAAHRSEPDTFKKCESEAHFLKNLFHDSRLVPISHLAYVKWERRVSLHAGTVIWMVRIKWERGNEITQFSMVKNLSGIREFTRDLWFEIYEKCAHRFR